MVYWPQFQHKSGQLQGQGGALDDDDGSGLAVIECLPALRRAATAGDVRNQTQDGTVQP